MVACEALTYFRRPEIHLRFAGYCEEGWYPLMIWVSRSGPVVTPAQDTRNKTRAKRSRVWKLFWRSVPQRQSWCVWCQTTRWWNDCGKADWGGRQGEVVKLRRKFRHSLGSRVRQDSSRARTKLRNLGQMWGPCSCMVHKLGDKPISWDISCSVHQQLLKEYPADLVACGSSRGTQQQIPPKYFENTF